MLIAAPVSAQSFGWRGDGTGRCPGADPPIQWDIDEGTGILWQTRIGKGQSSPVILDQRIFVTAEPDALVCLARDSGKVLWRVTNGYDSLPTTLRPPAALSSWEE